MHITPAKRLRLAIILSLAAILAGCQSARDKSSSDFIQPLAMHDLTSGADVETPKTERELCIETAKSVAGQGHAKEAILLYEKAERLDPSGQPLDFELAPLYAGVGNTESAINRYRKVLARDGENTDICNNLAWTLMESGQLGEALNAVQQGLAAAPTNKRLLATKAVTQHRQGDRNNALNSFRTAFGPATAHHNMAILDLEQGNSELALEQAELATRQDECPPACIAFRDSLRENLTSMQTAVPIR